MILKRLAATALSGALILGAIPTAAAQTDFEKDPNFVPGQETSSFTGSSVLDVGIIAISTATIMKLATDNIPAARVELDKIAQQIGLAGSSGSSVDSRRSGGLDFDLERLARTNGAEDLAEQLAQIKALFGPVPPQQAAPAGPVAPPAPAAPAGTAPANPAAQPDMVGSSV